MPVSVRTRPRQLLGRGLTEFDLCELETAGRQNTLALVLKTGKSELTHMHDLLPPMKVILRVGVTVQTDINTGSGTENVNVSAHRWEYTPGMCASSTARGMGSSQRSGRHSWASVPHKVVSQFAETTFGRISVPLGTGIALTMVPSRMRIGSESGRITSLFVLLQGKLGTRGLLLPGHDDSQPEERCDTRISDTAHG